MNVSVDPAYDPRTLRILPPRAAATTSTTAAPTATTSVTAITPAAAASAGAPAEADDDEDSARAQAGLFVAGDSSGLFRGIVAAMVSGWYAGAQAGRFVRERNRQEDLWRRACSHKPLAQVLNEKMLAAEAEADATANATRIARRNAVSRERKLTL